MPKLFLMFSWRTGFGETTDAVRTTRDAWASSRIQAPRVPSWDAVSPSSGLWCASSWVSFFCGSTSVDSTDVDPAFRANECEFQCSTVFSVYCILSAVICVLCICYL